MGRERARIEEIHALAQSLKYKELCAQRNTDLEHHHQARACLEIFECMSLNRPSAVVVSTTNPVSLLPEVTFEWKTAMDTAARKKREQTYPELLEARRCRLVVLAFEVGGRWSDESLDFVRRLARAKARSQPEWLRASAAQAYVHRWSGMLAVAAQRAFAASLLELPLANENCSI